MPDTSEPPGDGADPKPKRAPKVARPRPANVVCLTEGECAAFIGVALQTWVTHVAPAHEADPDFPARISLYPGGRSYRDRGQLAKWWRRVATEAQEAKNRGHQ